jgi:8-oxo-dGTP pyrophosphatase MutT (NUDIX family)
MARKQRPEPPAASPGQKAQVAALPVVGTGGDLRVMLVTSRETHRWIIPKGWPAKGLRDRDAAAREAFEEAGLKGRISRTPIGWYRYFKRTLDGPVPCRVAVYRLDVDVEAVRWREAGERLRAWFSPEVAAQLVEEPELRALLLALAADPS